MVALWSWLFGRQVARADSLEQRLRPGRFRNLNYRLGSCHPPVAPAPLVVYLHGAGGAGEDNRSQLQRGNGFALSRLLEYEPCYVLAPQCPRTSAWWSASESPSPQGMALLALIDELSSRLPIDPARVYLLGPSMGGHGVWDLGWREPSRWAALVPICGAAPPGRLEALASTPIWCFHGELDNEVPVECSRRAVQTLRRLRAPIRYTELAGIGHSCTREVVERDDLLAWVFQQRRDRFTSD